MGREFELKFSCGKDSFRQLLADYAPFSPIAMETTYYDTFDGKISNQRWTLRRRYENGRSICTLKTPAKGGGRCEWEVEAGGIMGGIPKLCQLGAPILLMELTVSGVIEVCGARFTRQARLLEIPGATVELALDEGCLTGGGREMPLLEVEVEVKSGSEEAATTFARQLAEEYGLTVERKSKYRRALGLARGE